MIEKKNLKDAEKNIRKLEKEVDLTLFHTFDWLNILHKTLKINPEIYIFNNNREITGFVPTFPKKSGIKIHFSPPFSSETAYGGIVCKGNEQKHYEELKKSIKNFFFVLPEKLKLKGMICEPKYTILTKLDAKNADEHHKRIKKGHRYNIRKAAKDNILQIKEDYSEKALKQYYDLLKKTYGYKGYKPLPYQFYKEIIAHYHWKNKCKFLIAYKDKKPIGTICAIIYKDKLHYWTGGFLRDSEYTKLYPNDVLQWEIIKWGYERKLKVYDMLGADLEGIRRFKLGFGGELVEYTKIFSSKKLHILSKAYSKAGQRIKTLVRKSS
ncbi:MAG: GNAT family N-acetyltransferase [Nanoarchaeota archaeon]|nr:GNAT family N-acetyltransferase [Nanoarchaeota archaeon]